jgi:hypothetical protein
MTSQPAAKLEAAQNKKRFLAVFPEVVEELVGTLRIESMPTEIIGWYKRVSFLVDLFFCHNVLQNES